VIVLGNSVDGIDRTKSGYEKIMSAIRGESG
jgi:hypothetical protein